MLSPTLAVRPLLANRHAGPKRPSLAAAQRPLLGVLVALALSACGNKDPRESFELWSNNQAGWDQMRDYVKDSANPAELRAEALEILTQGGHPSKVMTMAAKASDKEAVLLALRPRLEKLLQAPNEKQQLNAKQVLFDMLGKLPAAEADKTKATLAQWGMGDLTHDDPTAVIADKIGKRLRPDEIEKLGVHGVKGAEVLLSKAVAKNEVLVYLQSLNAPEAKAAIVSGLRRYHTISKKVKVSEAELGFVQRTKHIDGMLYFFELHDRLSKSDHPDDVNAGNMGLAAAVQWADEEDGRKLVKENWDKLAPVMQKLLSGANCDPRWWAVSQMIRVEGEKGLAAGLAALPEDANYGKEEHALNDVKLMITDLCAKDAGAIDKAKTRPIFIASLAKDRFIETIVAIRCLMVDGSDDARTALGAFIESRKKNKEEKIIDPLIVPQHAENLTLPDLAKIAIETIDYGRSLDKLATEGKLTAKQAEYRKLYASYSFDRKGKDLAAFAEERAEDKLKREAEKK